MGGRLTDAEKAEMYRKQLGGTNAALNREKQRCRGAYKRIGELEELVLFLYQEVLKDNSLVDDIIKGEGGEIETIEFVPPWCKDFLEPIRNRITAAGIDVPEIEYRMIDPMKCVQ